MKSKITRLAIAVASVAGVCVQSANVQAEGNTSPVQPTVDCVQRGLFLETFWFGYDNVSPADEQVHVNVGNDNSIVETRKGRIVATANRGQVTDFHRGSHRRAFAVTVIRGSSLTWNVRSANRGSTSSGALTATTAGAPLCPNGTPWSSASAQGSSPRASVTVGSTRELNANGLLVKADLTIAVSGISSACSVGTPLTPKVLFGYSDLPGENLVPLTPSEIVRVDTFDTLFGPVSYQRSYSASRTIADPQRIGTIFGREVMGDVLGGGIVDVTARCKIGPFVVESTEALWLDARGINIDDDYFYTDPATQTVVAYDCIPGPGSPCVVGPRGGLIR